MEHAQSSRRHILHGLKHVHPSQSRVLQGCSQSHVLQGCSPLKSSQLQPYSALLTIRSKFAQGNRFKSADLWVSAKSTSWLGSCGAADSWTVHTLWTYCGFVDSSHGAASLLTVYILWTCCEFVDSPHGAADLWMSAECVDKRSSFRHHSDNSYILTHSSTPSSISVTYEGSGEVCSQSEDTVSASSSCLALFLTAQATACPFGLALPGLCELVPGL